MTTRTLNALALSLLLSLIALTSTACGGTAVYAGLSAASLAGGGLAWYLAGEEMEAAAARESYLKEALNGQTYACDALQEPIASVMIEKGYSYSAESTGDMHVSDWDYFRPEYDDQWNKIHNGGRRRLLFEATRAGEGCQVTAFKQTLYNNASEATRSRELEIELAILQRLHPTRFNTIQEGALAAYSASKE